MTDETVASLGEHGVIARIRARVPPPPTSVVLGIGDDGAVVEPDRGALSVMTTDALVEGVHFDCEVTPMAAVGYKAMAVSLSDLASMGATPRHALLSVALPGTLPIHALDAMIDGLLEVADRYGTTLVGGNVTRSPGPLFVDVTAFGSVGRRRILTRAGARPGDDLYVSGDVGGAAAGLASLARGVPAAPASDVLLACRERYWRPEPRVRLGMQLGRARAARACVDLSDGLADGIRQLATAGGGGATIDADLIPVAPCARAWFDANGADPVRASLIGGEDYELLFAVAPTMRRRLKAALRRSGPLAVTRIGRLTSDPSLSFVRDGKRDVLPHGYEHFGNQ